MYNSIIDPNFYQPAPLRHYPAESFPTIHPVHWLNSHFAVGGWSPLQRLSGMITAHMTRIAPHNGFTWHPHRGLEIYTWVLEGNLYHEDTTGGLGFIRAGELQRMFSGDWIEHQELNQSDEPVRVIQIWYAARLEYRGVGPHYQQTQGGALPARQAGDATVVSLIGDDSPMEQHMQGRLTATTVPAGGITRLEPPRDGEDLFVYVTDGAGRLSNGIETPLGPYDVILGTPETAEAAVVAGEQTDNRLHFLSFYLPSFLPR